MSDLISRAEIISTFAELGKTGRYGGMCEWVIEIVEQLPTSELSTNLAEVGMDCISREKAIDVATSATMEWDGMYVQDLNVRIREAIEKLPPIQPKRGRWIHDGSKWKNRWVCSECGYKWFFDCIEGAYCPNCGADMRGE